MRIKQRGEWTGSAGPCEDDSKNCARGRCDPTGRPGASHNQKSGKNKACGNMTEHYREVWNRRRREGVKVNRGQYRKSQSNGPRSLHLRTAKIQSVFGGAVHPPARSSTAATANRRSSSQGRPT